MKKLIIVMSLVSIMAVVGTAGVMAASPPGHAPIGSAQKTYIDGAAIHTEIAEDITIFDSDDLAVDGVKHFYIILEVIYDFGPGELITISKYIDGDGFGRIIDSGYHTSGTHTLEYFGSRCVIKYKSKADSYDMDFNWGVQATYSQ